MHKMLVRSLYTLLHILLDSLKTKKKSPKVGIIRRRYGHKDKSTVWFYKAHSGNISVLHDTV